MYIKRVVDSRFWEDQKVMEDFSPEDKLFMLYLMTNIHTTQLGIYRILYRQMAFEIGYSVETIKVLIDRFENQYGIIKYSPETNEVAIKNYLCYSIVSGGKPVLDLLKKDTKLVQDKSLLEFILQGATKSNNQTVRFFCHWLTNKDNNNDKQNDNKNDNDNEDVNDNDNDNEKSYHHSSTNRITNRITNRKEIPIYSDYVRRADS